MTTNYDNLTDEALSALPDRGLTELVALRVMGWYWGPIQSEEWKSEHSMLVKDHRELRNAQGQYWYLFRDCDWLRWASVLRYATDISAAFLMVEKMRTDGWSFACTLYEGHLPYASFCKQSAASSRNAEADTLPRAICLAALAAVERKE